MNIGEPKREIVVPDQEPEEQPIVVPEPEREPVLVP